MGMFDTVMVACPQRGKKHEAQSKGGSCVLNVHELADCPFDVLADVNRHAPFTCEKCGTQFNVRIVASGFVERWLPEVTATLYPCDCTAYNGGQCFNCLNGAHNICTDGQGRCSQSPRSKP